MKVQPVSGRILVKKHVMSEKSEGGIFLPQTAQDDRQILADVIAIGGVLTMSEGCVREPPAVVGDVVLFSKCCGDAIKIDSVEHLIIGFHDVLATVKE